MDLTSAMVLSAVIVLSAGICLSAGMDPSVVKDLSAAMFLSAAKVLSAMMVLSVAMAASTSSRMYRGMSLDAVHVRQLRLILAEPRPARLCFQQALLMNNEAVRVKDRETPAKLRGADEHFIVGNLSFPKSARALWRTHEVHTVCSIPPYPITPPSS